MKMSIPVRATATLMFMLMGCRDSTDVVSPHPRLLGSVPFRTVNEVSFSLRGQTYGTTGGKFFDGSPAYCANGGWAYNNGWNNYPIVTGHDTINFNPILGDTVRAFKQGRTCTSVAASGDPIEGGYVNMYVTPPGQNRQFVGQVVGDYSNEALYTTVPENFLVTFDGVPNSGCAFIRYSGGAQSYSSAYLEISAATLSGYYLYAEFTCSIGGGGGGD